MKSKVCIILRKQSETGIAEDEVIISGKNEFFEKVKVFDILKDMNQTKDFRNQYKSFQIKIKNKTDFTQLKNQ